MTLPPAPGLIDSVRARLRNLASADGADFQALLERYAIERLLYRIARSPLRDRFVLKGATLFLAWGGDQARPTRDLDLLSFGRNDVEDLIASFRAIATTPVEADGLVYPAEVIKGAPIKVGQKYEGVRLAMFAMLGKVRIPVQVDVGFGDAVEPDPLEGPFPTLLDFPAPHLRLYPREVVVAEKFHALVTLEMLNTRLKDFHDLWALSRAFAFEGSALCGALRATFKRRDVELPVEVPIGLTAAYARHAEGHWLAFTRKSGLPAADLEATILPAIAAFLMPVVLAAREEGGSPGTWSAGGPWKP